MHLCSLLYTQTFWRDKLSFANQDARKIWNPNFSLPVIKSFQHRKEMRQKTRHLPRQNPLHRHYNSLYQTNIIPCIDFWATTRARKHVVYRTDQRDKMLLIVQHYPNTWRYCHIHVFGWKKDERRMKKVIIKNISQSQLVFVTND